MDFIGRERELEDLELEYQRGKSFVVLYGRRRIGKTALIKKFIENKEALYFLATEEAEIQSMKRFAYALSEFSQQEFLKNANFNDWLELFKIFANLNTNKTKILIIDEFQYLVNSNPAFTSIFQKIWDEILAEQNIMLIICGSYINMMTREILAEKSPLYGRRTMQIKLAPLSFIEIQKANPQKSFIELVEEYGITGGVPKYMEFFANNNSLIENIKHTILNKNGFLYDEPAFLLNKEVKEPLNYYSIMKVIAQENHKLAEISAALQITSSKLSPYLETLRELYLVKKLVPISEKNPEKSRKSLYIIQDIFIRFWFKFIFPYKGELELDNQNFVLEKLKNNFIDNHLAFVYEDICCNIFIELCKEQKIHFIPSRIGSFWDRNIELDIVAIDESQKQIFIGECKYHNKELELEVYYKLLEKVKNIKEFKNYKIIYGLFSKSGFATNLINFAKENNLILINELQRIN